MKPKEQGPWAGPKTGIGAGMGASRAEGAGAEGPGDLGAGL